MYEGEGCSGRRGGCCGAMGGMDAPEVGAVVTGV